VKEQRVSNLFNIALNVKKKPRKNLTNVSMILRIYYLTDNQLADKNYAIKSHNSIIHHQALAQLFLLIVIQSIVRFQKNKSHVYVKSIID